MCVCISWTNKGYSGHITFGLQWRESTGTNKFSKLHLIVFYSTLNSLWLCSSTFALSLQPCLIRHALKIFFDLFFCFVFMCQLGFSAYPDWGFSVFFLSCKANARVYLAKDRLCGLVVRVSGYRYRGLGFDSRRYQIFWVVVGLERGSLSLVRSIEELLEFKK